MIKTFYGFFGFVLQCQLYDVRSTIVKEVLNPHCLQIVYFQLVLEVIILGILLSVCVAS